MAAPEPTTSSLVGFSCRLKPFLDILGSSLISSILLISQAASLTQELLHELIADIAIEEHELSQFRKNRLNQLSPLYAQNGHLSTNGTATPGVSPTKKERDEGLFSCVVCKRIIAAPRYASHLSGCMGLSGSRRGERRAAANAAGNGKPSRNGGSGASSYGSDTDTEKKNGANGIKRSASTTSTSGQNKKSKPTPLASTPSSFQPPHIGSHPLSKTMSLPASPVGSPTAAAHSIPPRPSSVAPGALPPSQQQRIPSKQPAIAQTGRPPHPLAQTQHLPPVPLKQPIARSVPSNPTQRNDDRPDSDSEDSDSDLEIMSSQQHQSTTSSSQASKTPRVPPPTLTGAVGHPSAAGVGVGMQRNGSAAGASQKQPRKGMNMTGAAGGQAIGRKAARPIAGVNHDSASSDEDASDGSGSD
ncbi:uncharacterized protein JCM6883_002111 [Sporobolomyces salmoneus]|uniref:uncharacterized protein n=1 Tax=Sporobolomyces salmoneus TaxID=183962 RepID=UPI0031759F68